MFDIKSPCKTCPFRKGNGEKFQLSEKRINEITEATAFQCHNTVDYTADCATGCPGDRPQQCAGLMTVLRNEGRPNTIMQVAIRLGSLNLADVDPKNEAYASLDLVKKAHKQNDR
jgi:hypothetical protein